MARRKKHTPLEDEISAEWDRLCFAEWPHGAQISDDEWRELARKQMPAWDALLNSAYDGDEWLVDHLHASMIANGRSSRWLILQDVAASYEELRRLASHPGPRSRSEQEAEPIRLYLTRWAFDPSSESLGDLERHLDSGIYPRSTTALAILRQLFFFLSYDFFPPQDRIDPPTRSLMRALAEARKAPRRLRLACEMAETWTELEPAMTELAGFSLVEPDADSQTTGSG